MNLLDKRVFSGWPSGDSKPILELVLCPNELSDKYDIDFVAGSDDLDEFCAAHFYDSTLGFVVLMKHLSSPVAGTLLYVDSLLDSKDAIAKVSDILKLSDSDIAWKS